MARTWTVGQKIGAGFAATVALALVISVVATVALRTVVASKDSVITVNAPNLIESEKLSGAAEAKDAAILGYVFTGESRFLDTMRANRAEFAAAAARLRQNVDDDRELERIQQAEAAHQTAAEKVIAARAAGAAAGEAREFDQAVTPRFRELEQEIAAFVAKEQARLDEGTRGASHTAGAAIVIVLAIGAGALLLGIVVAILLGRGLSKQIGTAIHHVQSSSTELQAAANQQASGAKEQAAATNETTTTIRELVATARQIAESAQRVAGIADETARAARAGDQTMQRAREALAASKRQVDLIVTHMLELGKKSQQIGGVLEVINELSEQTNILAINATIEAAGAGDSGKRFSVVADEIRKLADRVGGSTKDIRTLIDEIRAAVNTTVMATEAGTKAVDAGAKQFADVTSAFGQIVGLVGTTTEAAREIELSTKQQTTAVEQVNVAMQNVAQAAKETEASSSQTLATAAQLTTLSRDLSRLIQAHNGVSAQTG